ncbi:hypothetical protein [Paenibacillus sp. MER 78]|uniref:hypothetical protein n=1 Tax=Paenibacillus sp. MER 78 TaxID=2939571 RepID=UPI00203FEC61|nr:hypothetical protein [Paenibacillus sp. MER 78]MCM3130924.1 hypothetical protein [Paenibacillus sp. MER 78]
MSYVPKSPFILEMCEVIAESMRKKGTWPNCTAEDIHASADRYEQIPSWYWDALADLKRNNYYRSLDEVVNPTEEMYVLIRLEKSKESYVYRKGNWVNVGDTRDL